MGQIHFQTLLKLCWCLSDVIYIWYGCHVWFCVWWCGNKTWCSMICTTVWLITEITNKSMGQAQIMSFTSTSSRVMSLEIRHPSSPGAVSVCPMFCWISPNPLFCPSFAPRLSLRCPVYWDNVDPKPNQKPKSMSLGHVRMSVTNYRLIKTIFSALMKHQET